MNYGKSISTGNTGMHVLLFYTHAGSIHRTRAALDVVDVIDVNGLLLR